MQESAVPPVAVNYDEPALVELEREGTDYRLDPGRGAAVAISHRPSGRWQWAWLAEGRWDGARLRAKPLGFELSNVLSQALAEAMRNREL